jgi:tRNA-dihydrouridine synthase 3
MSASEVKVLPEFKVAPVAGSASESSARSSIPDDDSKEAKGSHRDGGDRRGTQSKGQGVCFAFQRKGECKLGDSCKFSHAVSTEAANGADGNAESDVGDKRELEDSSEATPFSKRAQRNQRANSRPQREDRLCSSTQLGQTCTYEACHFSHDVNRLLASKEPDLPGRCHPFDIFGYCPSGFTCRFGGNHIQTPDLIPASDLKSSEESGEVDQPQPQPICLRRSEEEGGVLNRDDLTWNSLSKDVQALLRRKKYNFKDYAANNLAATLYSNEGDNLACNNAPFPEKVRIVDFSNKVYIAPLTTVGNTPFRRVLKDFGADITCGEMAMAHNLEQGQSSEWALLKRHKQEDVYGVQIAGCNTDTLGNVAQLLEQHTRTDFIDLNCGCPIDVVTGRGAGSALMNRPKKIVDIVDAMTSRFSRSMTVKIRTGWNDNDPTAHKIVPMLQFYNAYGNTSKLDGFATAGASAAAAIKAPSTHTGDDDAHVRFSSAVDIGDTMSGKLRDAARHPLSCVFIHGRSRQQRYKSLANWEYVAQCAKAQNPEIPLLPVIGNGDIMTWEDWESHRHLLRQSFDGDAEQMGLTSCAMMGRGALIKPWLPKEIHSRQTYDISATERMDMLKNFVNYGYEHWGTDNQGIENTRRFLLEWLSYLHRYVPAGILEHGYSQKMIDRPPTYVGRSDTETLLASGNSKDWIKISEILISPVGPNFRFEEKHKSSAYSSASGQGAVQG